MYNEVIYRKFLGHLIKDENRMIENCLNIFWEMHVSGKLNSLTSLITLLIIT